MVVAYAEETLDKVPLRKGSDLLELQTLVEVGEAAVRLQELCIGAAYF